MLLNQKISVEFTHEESLEFLELLKGLKKIIELTNSISAPEQDLIPIEEAMKITNLARQTLYGKVYDRKIPFIKREGSRKLFFSRKALLEWLQEGGN